VFLGGGAGSATRYMLTLLFQDQSNMFIPIHTLLSNLAACFILGFTVGVLELNNKIDPKIALLVTTGFCGGLSTFSTFVADSHQLVNLSKDYLKLFTNISLNLIGCFIFYICGQRIVGLIS
jgi:fluoride exporter